MRPDGSGERLLTQDFLVEGPTWAPNGRVLMYFRQGRTDSRGGGGTRAALYDRPDRTEPARRQHAGRALPTRPGRRCFARTASLGGDPCAAASFAPSAALLGIVEEPVRKNWRELLHWECICRGSSHVLKGDLMFLRLTALAGGLADARRLQQPARAGRWRPGGPGAPVELGARAGSAHRGSARGRSRIWRRPPATACSSPSTAPTSRPRRSRSCSGRPNG